MRKPKREQYPPEYYRAAHNFTGIIKASKVLNYQQKATLCGQANHGDLEGAFRGYERIMRMGEA